MSDDDRRIDTDPAAGVPVDVPPPPDLKPAVVGRLRAEGLLVPAGAAAPDGAGGGGRAAPVGGSAVGPALRWSLAAAAVVVAFLAGRITAGPAGAGDPGGVGDPVAGAAGVGDAPPRWAFLLYEEGMLDIGDLTLAEVEGEYVAWAREAAAAGTLVLGEKLAEVEFVLDSEAPPLERPLGMADPPGVLTGMFVVEAPTLEAAVEAARSTPHRAFGGTVLIRPIDPT